VPRGASFRKAIEEGMSRSRSENRQGRTLRSLSRGGGLALLVVLVLAGCSRGLSFQGLDTQQVYDRGVELFEDGEWGDAIASFERVLTTDPGFPLRAEARMYLARSHFGNEEYILAANEFEMALIRHPTHPLAPEASLGICRSYRALSPIPPRDQEYTRRAESACRQTANEFRGTPAGEQAGEYRVEMTDRLAEKWYDEGRFYQRRNLHNSALIVFQDVVDHFPQTRWAPMAMLGLYRSYETLGWTDEMSQTMERLLLLYPDSDAAREVSRERADGNGSGAGED
jgi:outer membrane protein assembly factor BamD